MSKTWREVKAGITSINEQAKKLMETVADIIELLLDLLSWD